MKRLLILLLVTAAVLSAQTQNERERVRAELERTDEMLRDAEDPVRRSGVAAAVAKLQEANSSQDLAWSDFRGSRLRMAVGRTVRARELVRQAVELARFDPERVRAEVRRTRERMNEIKPVVVRANVPRALELWRIAEGEQQTAERSLEAQRWLLALKFTKAARDHGMAAWRLVSRAASPERVERLVERVGALIDRVSPAVRSSGNARAIGLLDRAAGWLLDARAALARRDLWPALKRALAARDLALRAWEMSRGSVGPDMTEQALAETDRLLEDWADDIAAADKPEALRLLDQARAQQRLAVEHSAANRFAAAWAATANARRLVDRAVELIEAGQ
ncbi:MAG: hypothetical protein R6X13_03105 [bacterium]